MLPAARHQLQQAFDAQFVPANASLIGRGLGEVVVASLDEMDPAA